MPVTKRIAFVLSNQSTSSVTGWPIGFWLGELTHPLREFQAVGCGVELFSPLGGALYMDDYSDPYAENGYSADDEVSKEFLADTAAVELIQTTRPLAELEIDSFDAVFLVGGQGPMETFHRNEQVATVVRDFYESGKPTVVICHATCVLLDVCRQVGVGRHA